MLYFEIFKQFENVLPIEVSLYKYVYFWMLMINKKIFYATREECML